MGMLKICIVLICFIFIQIDAANTETTSRPCPTDSLPCTEGGCVARGKWCDGEEDCQDKSDEAYCKLSRWYNSDPNSCESSFFLCKNGPCIPLVGRCDGFDDCKDNSDEKNCETNTLVDYDDYILSVSTAVAPTEITTIETSSESEELENVDLTTATQTFFTQGVSLTSSTGSYYSQRMEEESLQTNVPDSTKPPTTKQPTLLVTDPVTSQAKITSTISSKPIVTYTTKSYDSSRRSSLNTILTSTIPAFDPRRLSTPSPTFPTQPKRAGYQRSHDIQTSTPTYYPTRSYTSGLVPNTKNSQTYGSPDRRSFYQFSTQTPRYLEARGTTTFLSQTHSYDTRRESYNYPNQPYVPPSSRNVIHNQPLRPVNPIQPLSSFPQTRTDTYQHQIPPISSQGSSRTIIGNQQQYRPLSNLPTNPPYDNRPQTYDTRRLPSRTRQQNYDDRQLRYDNRQQPSYNRELPYGARQQPPVNRPQPYDNRQQPNRIRHEPFDNRPQTYDPRRNRDQYQPPISRQYPYIPTSQVEQNPLYEDVPGAIINGFQVKRIYSSDRKYWYEGYYNQDGHFVQTKFNQRRLQPYTDRRPPPPKRQQLITISTAAPVVFDGMVKAPSKFYFAKNYTKLYGHENSEFVEKARDWILSSRDSDGGWGKDTPRALIALSLINNNFDNETFDNSLMQKQFQVYLGTSLIRGDTKAASVNQLSMWINTLLATCQNPRDFLGTDFTELVRSKLIKERLRESEDRIIGARSVNPFVYLSLCLADTQLQRLEVHDLTTQLQDHSALDEFEQDKQTMALSAFACHLHQQRALNISSSEYQWSMDLLLSNATSRLLKRMREDGSFGSLYSTAIAAQALMSVNDTQDWDPELTFDFLKEHQKDDGSFGDFLATYLVLPALSGRSLLHLRNTQCSPPNSDRALTPTEILAHKGPKHHVRYSLFIGYPKTNGYTIEVLVPKGISFFDIMRVAAYKNDAYKFTHEETGEEMKVYSISDIPNDSERGFEWNLYATSRSNPELDKPNPEELVRKDIRNYFPSSDQHIIFWYKPSDEWT